MTQAHQITGLGPVQEDGSREVFTVAPAPFVATKEMLDHLSPEVGDYFVFNADGSQSLLPANTAAKSPSVVVEEAVEDPEAAEEQFHAATVEG